MQGYLYMEDRDEAGHQRWGTPATPASRKLQAPARFASAGVVPRSLIALDKAALGVSEDWRDRISLKCAKRKESSVRVVARFRPPSEQELQAEGRDDCRRSFRVCPESHRVEAVDGTHTWEFDMAFGECCSQEAVYNAAGHPVISSMLEGYNGTIFAYGQTGSGKTHCMFGPSHDLLYQTSSDYRGIVPRAAQHVFDHIRNGEDGSEFVLRCSLFEVYREQLRDLLDPTNANLRIKETPRQGVFVDGLAQEFVACEDDVVQLLRAGSRLRAVAATRLNQHSSRSHVIFSLTCEQRLVDGTEKLAKLNLVDLAGSEKVWKSHSSGVTLEEAKKINLSLSALGNVISALASRREHIPYRNSKLTRILQETLGGNFKTALVVTCSPLRMHLDETLSSLHFATRAKAVCNHVKMNFVYSAEQLMAFAERLQHELLTTKREIAKHTGGPIPVGPPEASMASIAAAPSEQALHWDASMLDKTSGPSPSPALTPARRRQPRGPSAAARLVGLSEETKRRLKSALVAQERLMGDLKAVIGAGLAHELRSGAAVALVSGSGSATATPADQSMSWLALDVQQNILHKQLKMKDMGQRFALLQRRLRELEARRDGLARYYNHLDASMALTQQVASDLQTQAEGRASPLASPSRILSPRERRTSAGSEVSGMLRGELVAAMAAPAATDRSFSMPEMLPSYSSLQRPSTTLLIADSESATPGMEGEVESLRQELEMLQVDMEREEAMRHLLVKEEQADRQQWYRRAHAKLRDLDQAVNEEPRLYDLLQRRRAELLARNREVVRRRQELQAKEHELSTDEHLENQSSPAVCATSSEDAKLQSKGLEVNEAIIRLKEKKNTLCEEAPEMTCARGGA